MIHQLLHGKSSPAETPLTSDEIGLFEQLIITLEELPAFQRDLGHIIESYKDDLLNAVSYAKHDFGNIEFGGLYPSSGQFGARLIRAETVFATKDGSLYWSQNIPAGWSTLFTINTNASGLSNLPGTQLKDNVTVATFGLLDPTTVETIEQIQIAVGGTTYPVIDRNDIQASNFYFIPFGGLMYIGKNANGTISVNSNKATTTRARAYGLEFYLYEFGLNQQ